MAAPSAIRHRVRVTHRRCRTELEPIAHETDGHSVVAIFYCRTCMERVMLSRDVLARTNGARS